jgi:hypothetical protein
MGAGRNNRNDKTSRAGKNDELPSKELDAFLSI